MSSRNVYLEFVKRWYWLVAIGAVIGLVATHLAIQDRTDLYRSTATLQIGRAIDSEAPQQAELTIIDRLVTVYGEMATRNQVLEAVIETLELPYTPDGVRARLHVRATPSTQLVDITVIDSDREVAAAIANEVARQLALTSPGPTADQDTQRFLTDQLNDLQFKISDAQDEIESLEASKLEMTSAADIFDADQRLGVLNAQVGSWQDTYATLVMQLEPSATNVVRIFDEAQPANGPLPQQTTLYYGFGLVMGAGLATLLALGLSHFRREIRRSSDLAELDDPHPIVDVPTFRSRKTTPLVTLREPTSSAASAYRVLRNLVKLEMGHGEPHSLMVTSSRIGEGKTTTTANLGLALANSGSLVILVDANFHNPELDELFDTSAQVGFSDLLLDRRAVRDVVQETEHPYLWLVGSGSIPYNYLDVLASEQMDATVRSLLEHADIVLFDTPALDQEQESQLLAKSIKTVILIAESAHTVPEALKQAIEQVESVGAKVEVIVVNKVRPPWHTYVLRWPWSRERRLEAKARERRIRKAGDLAEFVQKDGASADAAD